MSTRNEGSGKIDCCLFRAAFFTDLRSPYTRSRVTGASKIDDHPSKDDGYREPQSREKEAHRSQSISGEARCVLTPIQVGFEDRRATRRSDGGVGHPLAVALRRRDTHLWYPEEATKLYR